MWVNILAAAVLAVAAWQDGTTKKIPDYLIILLAVCGLAKLIWGGSLLSALAGFAICGIPTLVLSISLKHGFIGGGDVKLCAALGWLLGPVIGSMVILLALIGLSAYGLLWRQKVVPFAPFVFPAYLIMLFL